MFTMDKNEIIEPRILEHLQNKNKRKNISIKTCFVTYGINPRYD